MKALAFSAFLLLAMIAFAGVTSAQDSHSTASIDISLANHDPDPARAGENLELRFTVENLGATEARNLEFELVPKYPFVAIPGEDYTRTISTLSAFQSGDSAVVLKYEVRVDKDAVKGTNEIDVKRVFADTDVTTTKTFEIEVRGTEYAQIIYVDKSKLYPGNETPLKFTITNVGNSPLRDLVFSWNEEDGVILPVYSDDTKYIKSIDVGESVDLEYIVVADVNAEQGLYQLDLSLSYETESGVTEEMSTKAGIFVGGETDFDVTFSESSEGLTSLSLANVGNNPAYSVTVSIPEQSGYRVTGSTSTIVGNLDKGDYTIVSFQISQGVPTESLTDFSQMTQEERAAMRDSMAQKDESNLVVAIQYTDTTGTRHVLEKDVPIQFRSTTTSDDETTVTTTRFGRTYTNSTNQLYTYGGIAVLAIVVAVGFVKRKRLVSLAGRMKKKG